jgi:hypothetical protein
MSPSPVVRTPSERFDALADYPYAPRWLEVDGLRVAGPFVSEEQPAAVGAAIAGFLHEKGDQRCASD